MEQYLELKEKYFGLVLEAGEKEQELKDIEVWLALSLRAGTLIVPDVLSVWFRIPDLLLLQPRPRMGSSCAPRPT